jgi:hypothetical protein
MSSLQDRGNPGFSRGPTLTDVTELITRSLQRSSVAEHFIKQASNISGETSLANLLEIPLAQYKIWERNYLGYYKSKITPEAQTELKQKLLAILDIGLSITSSWNVEILPMGILSSTIASVHEEILDRLTPQRYRDFTISVEHLAQPSDKKHRVWFDNTCSKLLQVTINGKSSVFQYNVVTEQSWDGQSQDVQWFTGSQSKLGIDRFPEFHIQTLQEAWATLLMRAAYTNDNVHFSGDPSRLALPNHREGYGDLSRESLKSFYMLDIPLSPLEKEYEQYLNRGIPGSRFFSNHDPGSNNLYIDRDLDPKLTDAVLHKVRAVDSYGIPILTRLDASNHAVKTLSEEDLSRRLEGADISSLNLATIIGELMERAVPFGNDVARRSAAHAYYHLMKVGTLPRVSNETIEAVFLDLTFSDLNTTLQEYVDTCQTENPILLELTLLPQSVPAEETAKYELLGKQAIAIMYRLLGEAGKS